MMMSEAQRNAETVKQNQSTDMLILVSMNKLREMENELKAARDFIFEIRKILSFAREKYPRQPDRYIFIKSSFLVFCRQSADEKARICYL